MGAPKKIGGFQNPARRIQNYGNKVIGNKVNQLAIGKQQLAEQAEDARKREAGKAAQGDAFNILGNTDIDVRDKLDLVNSLLRPGSRIGQVDAGRTDESFGTEFNELRSRFQDSRRAVEGGATLGIKERFAKLVESSRQSKAKFNSAKKNKLDLPGQTQVRASTILGG